MSKCQHKASSSMAAAGPFQIAQCEQGCESVFMSFYDDNKNVVDMTRAELNVLRAENTELKQSLAWESKRVDGLHMQAAEDSIKLLVFAEVAAERDALRAILARIAADVERTAVVGGYAYAIPAGLVGEIDAVLKQSTGE